MKKSTAVIIILIFVIVCMGGSFAAYILTRPETSSMESSVPHTEQSVPESTQPASTEVPIDTPPPIDTGEELVLDDEDIKFNSINFSNAAIANYASQIAGKSVIEELKQCYPGIHDIYISGIYSANEYGVIFTVADSDVTLRYDMLPEGLSKPYFINAYGSDLPNIIFMKGKPSDLTGFYEAMIENGVSAGEFYYTFWDGKQNHALLDDCYGNSLSIPTTTEITVRFVMLNPEDAERDYDVDKIIAALTERFKAVQNQTYQLRIRYIDGLSYYVENIDTQVVFEIDRANYSIISTAPSSQFEIVE